MSQSNIRVPPDSTGKRTAQRVYLDLSYVSATQDFVVGDFVSGLTSGFTGEVSRVNKLNSTTGSIYVLLDHDSVETATLGENIQVANVTVAQAGDAGIPIYTQQVVLVGANNHFHGQSVDNKGAMSIRFTEGEAQFDAYGRMQNALPDTVAEYTNRFDDLPAKWSTLITGGATSTFNPVQHSVVLACGTNAGDKVMRRSNVWHKNQTGISQLVEMSVLVGDTGKTNVRRRWGYYDDDYGVYFELDGTTLYAVMRSTTSGSLVETRVAQADWNFDKVDGTGSQFNLSRVDLDLTKINNFWFDLMCSAGSARCGIIVNNQRIICHKFAIGNVFATEHLAVGTLPISYEQENTAATASSTEFRVYCSVVKSEGPMTNPYKSFGADNGSNVSVTSDTAYTPLFSGRAAETYKGFPNRLYILPYEIDVYTTEPVIVEMVKNATLTGDVWGPFNSSSGIEMDQSSTAATGGQVLSSQIVKDHEHVDLSRIFNNDAEMIIRKADITAVPDRYTFRAKTVNAATTALVRISVRWREM